ncbi:hypothetical protein KKF09_00390 [Patescibacteria group bacterium]|nr:hypothetical protein [Patescibacteria group bacterium]
MIKMRKIRSNKSLNQKVNKQAGKKKKGCGENEFLLAEAKRRRAETLGGIQSAKSSGFCSKKVRISSNKLHHIEFDEFSASPSPSARASAGSFASKLKGFLKSISSRPRARRKTHQIRYGGR